MFTLNLPPTSHRVALHTAPAVNASIDRHTRSRLDSLVGAGHVQLTRRLTQLDREWDTERVLETNASLLILFGLLMGKTVNRRWYLLSAGVAAFLLEHALQGWCPPLPVIRRLGVRTAAEIEAERAGIQSLLSRQ